VDLPLYGRMNASPALDLEGWTPREEPLGEKPAYGVPYDLRQAGSDGGLTAVWSAASGSALRARVLGPPVQVIAGKAKGGWSAVERDFLVLRHRGRRFLAATLYDVLPAGGPAAPDIGLSSLPVVGEQQAPTPDAAAYRVHGPGVGRIDVLVSFDGAPCRAADCRAGEARRIDVRIVE
jgi:hypothetical protein